MTKLTPILDEYFTDQAQTKMNLVTANILDGIKTRLKDKGSITPKQAHWLVERIKKHGTITPSLSEEIVSVLERGTLDEQRHAEKAVREQLVEQKVEEQANHFNSLYDSQETFANKPFDNASQQLVKEFVKELDTLASRFKSKVGL